MAFPQTYREYIRTARRGSDYGFNIKTVARLEPLLSFLYEEWWRVDLLGQKNLPESGPALIVGNIGGIIPWAAMMLMYALMSDSERPRRLNVLADLDLIEDERLYSLSKEIGFVPFSADNAKRLFAQDELVMVFPEGIGGATKPFRERYRLRSFDWTKLMPAIEQKVPIIPLATLGCEESFPMLANLDGLAKFLSMPAFPITPFFPLLPFPANMLSLPVKWKMRIMKPVEYKIAKNRGDLEETAKKQSLFAEGEIQAELNRLLRMRIKPLF